jgi:hypothetical protein
MKILYCKDIIHLEYSFTNKIVTVLKFVCHSMGTVFHKIFILGDN